MTGLRLMRYRDCEAALRHPALRQGLYDAGAVVMADTLLVLHGETHRRRRTLEMRVFRSSFLRHYETGIFPATLAQTMAPVIVQGRTDLIDLGYRLTANLTADFAGIDRPEGSPAETEVLIRMVKVFSEAATLAHSTRDPGQVTAEAEAALAEFRDVFVAPSMARRTALFAAGKALPRDILSIIVENEDRLDLPDEVIVREMAFYMQAGAHSTANATVHGFHEMLTWAGDDGRRQARLDDPRFVQRCVHESLRLHPASPEAVRAATDMVELAGHAVVPAGETVVLDLFQANRDPEVFGDDAALFDPERATPPGVPASGLTFGTGHHTCLGRELDGGSLQPPGPDPETGAAQPHQMGIISLVTAQLLALGARPDPADPPTPDPRTSRPNWGRYPVVFTRGQP